MRTINLIDPETSDIKFKLITFPDGQPHIKFESMLLRQGIIEINDEVDAFKNDKPIKIITRINTANDLLLVLLIKNTLDYYEYTHVELYISYLMAARMDRVMMEGEPFSLKVVANVLNQANFKKIKIFDPHSDVTTALIDRSYSINNHAFVTHVLYKQEKELIGKKVCLISPDAGALKKIHKLVEHLHIRWPKLDFEVVECMKERDVKTGTLTNFKVMADDLKSKICFIIDDICDGGGTFAGTGKALKRKGAEKVHLIVSHGIFSKGIKIDYIDDIYTTNSYKEVEGVNCFSVSNYL